jgi:sulfate adenylyltransferase subunit 1
MDLVDYKEERFEEIKEELEAFSSKLTVNDIRFIPISALKGDNVVHKSTNMDWYEGSTLMYTLENIHISSDENLVDCRFPVQYVIRPQSTQYHDYRGYAGRVAGGVFKKGDDVVVLPSGFSSKIAAIDTFNGEIDEAFAPMSVTLRLEDDIDIGRGDMIVRPNNQPEVGQDIDMMICWMGEKPLMANGKYAIKHTTKDARCIVKEIQYKVDINSLHRMEEEKNIQMNDIARIKIRTTQPLFYDRYSRNRITGSIILIDEATNETVGAGMIIE